MLQGRDLFAMGDGLAAEAVAAEHRDQQGQRVEELGMLLTELTNPGVLAHRLQTAIDYQTNNFRHVLDELDADAAKASPWFPRTRAALVNSLAQLDVERASVEERLAARLADKRAGLPSRDPDPDEEPDVVMRISAARRREALDEQSMLRESQRRTAASLQRMVDSRAKRPKR